MPERFEVGQQLLGADGEVVAQRLVKSERFTRTEACMKTERTHAFIHFLTYLTVLITLGLCVLDIATNAAAGAAATAAGAHHAHATLTTRMVNLGALAGTTKAGILAFEALISYGVSSVTAAMFLLLLSSPFGVCVLVTAEVTGSIYGSPPPGLLVAGLIAALPLYFENCGLYHSFFSKVNGNGGNLFLFLLPCWDALGGYTFAKIAQNKGLEICSPATAAAAGAVYGILTGFLHFLVRRIGGFCAPVVYSSVSSGPGSVFGHRNLHSFSPDILMPGHFERREQRMGRFPLLGMVRGSERAVVEEEEQLTGGDSVRVDARGYGAT